MPGARRHWLGAPGPTNPDRRPARACRGRQGFAHDRTPAVPRQCVKNRLGDVRGRWQLAGVKRGRHLRIQKGRERRRQSQPAKQQSKARSPQQPAAARSSITFTAPLIQEFYARRADGSRHARNWIRIDGSEAPTPRVRPSSAKAPTGLWPLGNLSHQA